MLLLRSRIISHQNSMNAMPSFFDQGILLITCFCIFIVNTIPSCRAAFLPLPSLSSTTSTATTGASVMIRSQLSETKHPFSIVNSSSKSSSWSKRNKNNISDRKTTSLLSFSSSRLAQNESQSSVVINDETRKQVNENNNDYNKVINNNNNHDDKNSNDDNSLYDNNDLPTVEFIDPRTGCQVILLGCFHGTKSSAMDVRRVITDDTNIVALELCATRFADVRQVFDQQQQQQQEAQTTSRFPNISDATTTSSATTGTLAKTSSLSSSSKSMPWIVAYMSTIQKTAKERGISTGIAAAILGGFSGIQTALSGFTPGLEFTTALECVTSQNNNKRRRRKPTRTASAAATTKNNDDNESTILENCDIVLADQDVDETLRQMGNVPLISIGMMMGTSNPFNEWRYHSKTLQRAIFGDKQLLERQEQRQRQQQPQENTTSRRHAHRERLQVQLVPVLTRNMDAIQDLVRLFIPPTFIFALTLVTFIVMYHQLGFVDGVPLSSVGLSDLNDLLTSDDIMTMSSSTSSSPYFDDEWTLANRLSKTCTTIMTFIFGYVGLALPAVRVVLTERDVILTKGIETACDRAGPNGRVVAILGLLHVNGVAKRMLLNVQSYDSNNKK